MRTVFSRGHGTADLARLMDGDAVKVGESITDAAVHHRAELLVARRPNAGRDLLPTAVPRDLDLDRAGRVVAAVGGGPHSELAAMVAAAVASALGVRSAMVCAYQEEEGPDAARATVERIADLVPEVEPQVVEGHRVHDALASHGDHALLVVGAPGGSFLQRQFLGPGARLIAHAEVGAVVVSSAPARVFQRMDEPVWVGRHLPAPEALRAHPDVDPIPVVDHGAVVGTVGLADLVSIGDAPVEVAMRPATVIEAADLLLGAAELGPGAIPVVHAGLLVGVLAPTPVGS